MKNRSEDSLGLRMLETGDRLIEMGIVTCPSPNGEMALVCQPILKSNHHPNSAVQTNSNRVWEPGLHCLELDGVRGIAIIGVTLYRYGNELDPSASSALAIAKGCFSVGERGVDLFFVLSGFLITGILLSTKSKSGFFRNFIVRRALRIFPLYFATLLVCLFIVPGMLSTKVFDLPSNNQCYLWTYTPNLYMAWENSWCFGPLDHFWSLAVEEHFYLLWPIAAYFLSTKSLLRVSVATVLVVGVIRAFASMWPGCSVAVNVLTIFRCDALCMGAILAIIMYQRVHVHRMMWFARRCLPFVAIASLVFVVTGKRWMTLPHTIIPALMVVVLAIIVTGKKSDWLSRQFRRPCLRWFGKYSYGMYVVQLPLVTMLPISTLTWTLGTEAANPILIGTFYVATMLGLTSVFAYVTFHQFENRFLSLKRYF